MKSALSYRGRCENEASRRLYRGAVETAQRLDHHLSQISNFTDFFGPETTDIRTRLKDYCERLMFTDPVAYGKKAEDLLWRKVYYEFFQKCKQNKKKLMESEFHLYTLHSNLLAAIGSYHHILLRIQIEFHLDLSYKVDVPFLWHQKGVKKERWKKYQQSAAADNEMQLWANQACHHILTYLGDLARYISELAPEQHVEQENRHLAQRYYLQAFCLNPKSGTPHNQLGSLANSRFDSAYHYMRCLASVEKFDAAEGNLVRIFEKNNHVIEELESVTDMPDRLLNCQRFLAKFLKLCEIFYFTFDENLQNHCQTALQYFELCLSPSEDNSIANACGGSDSVPDSLDNEIIFKIVVMCMMCITRLNERGSYDVSAATVFTVALFSSVLCSSFKQLASSVFVSHSFVEKIFPQEIIKNVKTGSHEDPSNMFSPSSVATYNNKDAANCKNSDTNLVSLVKKGRKMKKFSATRLGKLRRRRKISSTSQEDSEASDVEILDVPESDEENGVLNSDVSQAGSCSSESLSEHEGDMLSVGHISLENGSKSLNEDFNNMRIEPAKTLDKANSKQDVVANTGNEVTHGSMANGSVPSDVLLSTEAILQALKQAHFMPALKVLVDWLKAHKEVLTLYVEGLQFLLFRIVNLLNLLLKLEHQLMRANEKFAMLKRGGRGWQQIVPLPEDVLLQQLPALKYVHSDLVFDIPKRKDLVLEEQVFLRIQCILSFGDVLCELPETFLDFHKGRNEYSVKVDSLPSKKADVKTTNIQHVNNDADSQKQQLMHEMAHLWLKSEVNNLERSIKVDSSPQLSPLLVTDTSALCSHLPLLKQLIAAKNFVVIVPKVVIDNLDHLKKRSLGAREAIRWLEFVFQKGSRHIRAQRDGERSSVHPMKYPKRKDKDSWDYFQILECCHFLVQQQTSEKSACTLVTLLVGAHHHLPSNAAALARSLNLCMENAESFFTKWRSCTKKPG